MQRTLSICLNLVAGTLVSLLLTGSLYAGPTLDAVKSNGAVRCGVNESLPGFAHPDDKGNWAGFDVDFCRAVATAVFHDPDKVRFIPSSAKERFTLLQSGEADLLSRNTTWTFVRDSALGFDFAAITFYDGQGFMVPKKQGVKSARELSGASICLLTGTTTELNLADYFRTLGKPYSPVVFEGPDEAVAAYGSGRCDAFTTDRSGLAAQRVRLPNPEDHVVLPEVISKEPLGPLVRHGDNQWEDIVRWTIYAMILAEEKGVSSVNVDRVKKDTKDPEVRRLLGLEGDLGTKLGLDNDWAYHVLKQVGNYGEVYDRNVGPNTPLKLDRGLNAQWNQGGLLYAPPFR